MSIDKYWRWLLATILIINLIARLFIYHFTALFYFTDYGTYLNAIERINSEATVPMLTGNFLFGISYMGYFAKYLLGSLDIFFVLNCILATITTLVVSVLTIKVTGKWLSGIIAAFILTFYTEFMVFSSVFYTPVIMMFLVSVFILLLWYYITSGSKVIMIISLAGLLIIFLLTSFFKQELKFLPWFLLIAGVFSLRRNKSLFFRLLSLSFCLLSFAFLFNRSGIISHPQGNINSNAFIFFGHTDYGGDLGEGSFVYTENKIRYESALAEYCETNSIVSPTAKDYNAFHLQEVKKFITNHPFKWIGLQFTKFFRTFGIVPETTSFKILYTGLLKGKLWLTSFVVVTPVALIILLFVIFFNFSALKKLLNSSTSPLHHYTTSPLHHYTTSPLHHYNTSPLHHYNTTTLQHYPTTSPPYSDSPRPAPFNTGFLYIYLVLFIYYIIATIFFGQYQERYRLPVMVIFIIPALSYFIATFDKTKFFNKVSLIIKSGIIVLFLTIWVFQAKKAITNKDRLENAIETLK